MRPTDALTRAAAVVEQWRRVCHKLTPPNLFKQIGLQETPVEGRSIQILLWNLQYFILFTVYKAASLKTTA